MNVAELHDVIQLLKSIEKNTEDIASTLKLMHEGKSVNLNIKLNSSQTASRSKEKAELVKITSKYVCPDCNGPMHLKVNRTTGEYFAGCMKYPDCQGTEMLY